MQAHTALYYIQSEDSFQFSFVVPSWTLPIVVVVVAVHVLGKYYDTRAL